MSNAIERKLKNKCKKNLKYNDEFTSFLVILGGFSSRALDLFRQNLEGRTIQSIRYIIYDIIFKLIYKFLFIFIYFYIFRHLRRNSKDRLTDPDLCYENVARFKRLVDSIQYDGPVTAMTDNTKLKCRLRYSPTFGCIIGSVFPKEDTKIEVYGDIPKIVSKIKNEKVIAKDVRAYMLQVLFKIFKLLSFIL
jgi:hypothetical protein